MKRIFGRRLKNFDVFPKSKSEILERTRSGGIVTIIAGLILVYLAVSEFYDYVKWEPRDELFVDTSRDKKVTIFFDIVFYGLHCKETQLDVVDELGEQQNAVTHNVHKIKVNRATLETIMSAKVAKLGDTSTEIFPPDYCGPCEKDRQATRCCNTCESVLEYHKEKGLPISDVPDYEQCKAEHEFKATRSTEGCRLQGSIAVNKVQGNFHVAPGASGDQSHGSHSHHIHQINRGQFQKLVQTLDLKHKILALSFGPVYPGMVNPLDGYEMSFSGLVRHSYLLQVVPTEYESGWSVVQTHQFSVTNHTEVIDPNSGHIHLPGVFFRYDFSPFMVKIHSKHKSFSHFLTRLCAVVGGTWVSVGIFLTLTRKITDFSKKTN
eukprot:TRINITY_DN5956_c0_g1_i1.p1 TRINITY_DN5956_c0_g1~~TRINITY_DN5956_c0_g1_i1.p1  ORF type:complete len:378 (-),score=63.00 TRINITY_DN5956_c0_g1_i1:33-1166(-)